MKALAACLAVALLFASQSRALHIQQVGTLSEDQKHGVELAAAEMSQTAELLGFTLTLSEQREATTVGVVTVEGALSPPDLPVIHLQWPAGERQHHPCTFHVAAAPGELTWHASLDRYGASELNERFAKRYGQPMTDAAWNAWFAVKALVETALRAPEGGDRCAALARGRFDGHKGTPLSFDRATRRLVQPTYVIGRDGRATPKRLP